MTLVAEQRRAARPSAWRRLWWSHPELSLLMISLAAWLAVGMLHLAMPSHSGAGQCSMAAHTGADHHGAVRLDMVADRCAGVPSPAMSFLASLTMWMVMAAAMMLPTTLPAARSISLNGRWQRRHRGQAWFAAGYLAVWWFFGVVTLAVAGALAPKPVGSVVVSGTLAIAAGWELTRGKRCFLRGCHRVRSLPADGRRADRAAMGEGLRIGLRCTGACAPMMVPMALAPHALWLMGVLFGVVAAEKLVTNAVDHLRVFAAVLAAIAVIVMSGAPLG